MSTATVLWLATAILVDGALGMQSISGIKAPRGIRPRGMEPPTPPPPNPRMMVFQKAVTSAHEATATGACLDPALLCKPARDGVSVGDCPFTHYARMAMRLAGHAHAVAPTRPENKPRWLVDAHDGSLPCYAPQGLGNGHGALAESAAIAQRFLPPTPRDDAVLAATAGLFGAIAGYVKDAGDDAAKRAKVDAELTTLEGLLGGEPFLSGDAPGLADSAVATKLFVLLVAGGHYKGFKLDAPRVAVYWAAISAHEAFYATRYAEAEMLFGWGQARSGAH